MRTAVWILPVVSGLVIFGLGVWFGVRIGVRLQKRRQSNAEQLIERREEDCRRALDSMQLHAQLLLRNIDRIKAEANATIAHLKAQVSKDT